MPRLPTCGSGTSATSAEASLGLSSSMKPGGGRKVFTVGGGAEEGSSPSRFPLPGGPLLPPLSPLPACEPQPVKGSFPPCMHRARATKGL